MNIADQNPELAAVYGGAYHPLGTANSVEGRVFAVTFDDAVDGEIPSTMLPCTQRTAYLDTQPRSKSKFRPNKWLLARAQTLLGQRSTSLFLLGPLTLSQLAKLRSNERSDVLHQMLDDKTGKALRMLLGTVLLEPRVDVAREFEDRLLDFARDGFESPREAYQALRPGLESLCLTLGKGVRTPVLVDTCVWIDAKQVADGPSSEFLRYATGDFEVLVTSGVVDELGGKVPAGACVVPTVEPNALAKDTAAKVAQRRRKEVSATDLSLLSTAMASDGRMLVASHDADLWAVRDALLLEGETRAIVIRPC